jgi:hypothetical protein
VIELTTAHRAAGPGGKTLISTFVSKEDFVIHQAVPNKDVIEQMLILALKKARSLTADTQTTTVIIRICGKRSMIVSSITALNEESIYTKHAAFFAECKVRFVPPSLAQDAIAALTAHPRAPVWPAPLPQVLVTSASLLAAATSRRRSQWRSLPGHCQPLWATIGSIIEQANAEALNPIALCAPAIFLDRNDAPDAASLTAHLTELILSEKYRCAIVQQFLSEEVAVEDIIRGTSQQEAPSASARIVRAEKLIGLDCVSKAVGALASEDKVFKPQSLNDKELAQLKKLYPSSKAQAADLPVVPRMVQLHELRQTLLYRMAKGTAPSFDGWTRELLIPWFQADVTGAMHTLVTALTNASLPDQYLSFFRTSSLTLFEKPDGKLRPISLQAFAVKLAWKVQIAKISVKAVLHTSQLQGSMTCQRAVLRAQHALDEGHTIILLDASNAFGEVKRAAIVDELKLHPSLAGLHGLYNVTHSVPMTARLRLPNETLNVKVEEGVLQGCVAAPLLFQLGLASALKGLDATSHTHVLVTCVADDICISAAVSMRPTLTDLTAKLYSIGITLNESKCKCLGPQDATTYPTIQPVSRCDYLGGFLFSDGASPPCIADCRIAPKERLRALRFAAANGMHKQSLNLLARFVVGAFFYSFSTLPTKYRGVMVQEAEDACAAAIATLLPLATLAQHRRQLSLRDNHGGNCLTDWRVVAPELYSAVRCYAQINTHTPNAVKPGVALRAHNISLADTFWASATIPESKPSQTNRPLPRTINQMVRAKFHGSFHWNTIRPAAIELCLSDDQWTVNMHIRLRIQDGIDVDACDASPHVDKLEHLLNCNHCSPRGWLIRHQRILFAMLRALRKFGIYASGTDIASLFHLKREEGPDALVYTDDSVIAVDVSVSHQSSIARHDMTQARTVGKEKKYAALGALAGWKIAPLIFSTHCTATEATELWIKQITKSAITKGGYVATMQGMTIACARGNADLNHILSLAEKIRNTGRRSTENSTTPT